MRLYNLYYKADDNVIELKNITKQEIDKFLNSLAKHPNSSLKISKVITRNEEEEER